LDISKQFYISTQQQMGCHRLHLTCI